MKKISCLVSLILSASCLAQQDFSQVKIIPHQLGDNIYYLEGQGGNNGVSIGEGMSLEQIMAAGLTREYDDRWGDPAGVLPVVYNELISM